MLLTCQEFGLFHFPLKTCGRCDDPSAAAEVELFFSDASQIFTWIYNSFEPSTAPSTTTKAEEKGLNHFQTVGLA